MKESRPYILSFEKHEQRKERETEFKLSKYIDRYIARPLEKVDEWKNTYYIYEYIDGEKLYYELSKYGIFKFSNKDYRKNLELIKSFIEIVKNIFKIVEYMHNLDIVLNDIHPDNFILRNKIPYFIDLGNSYKYKEFPEYGIYNDIALKEWNKIDGKEADIKKVGNLILYCIGKLHIFDSSEIKSNTSLLKDLLKRYGIATNLDKFIFKILTEKISAREALIRLDNITIELNNLEYNLDLSNEIKNYEIDFDFYNFEEENNFLKIIEEYEFRNNKKLKYMIDKEKRFGLFGLSGVLFYLLENYDFENQEEIIEYGIKKIINDLIEYKGNRIISIKSYAGSPYISNGSSGFIKFLYEYDLKKYKDLILELAENLIGNFAQKSDYFNGMLGIADTLIDVCYIKFDKRYINSINEYMLNSLFYLKYGKINPNEFFYVYNRYKLLEEKYERFFKK